MKPTEMDLHRVKRFLLSLIILLTASQILVAGNERILSFEGASGTSIEATITLPVVDPGTKVAALVLIAGSGPTDRDGNQLPMLKTDLLKQIATKMAECGIATLRFDKRGMYANANQLPKDVKLHGDFFSWENFVGDVEAAFAFLQQQPEIDPSRVGFLGHSEGGLLALEAAADDDLQKEKNPPAVLVLLCTPGRKMNDVIEDQLRALLKLQRATPAQTTYFIRENQRITAAILKSGEVPSDVPPGLSALYPAYLGKFLHSVLQVDPAALAAQFNGPVLVVACEKDTQVSPIADAEKLDAALKARNPDDHDLFIVPGASHNLKLIQALNDPGFTGEIAPTAAEKLIRWTTEKLGDADTAQPVAN